jgi:hypothetical protein
MVLSATFNNMSVISWRSVILVQETGGPGENHQPVEVTDKRYQIMLCTSPWTRFSGDRHHRLHRKLLIKLPYDHATMVPVYRQKRRLQIRVHNALITIKALSFFLLLSLFCCDIRNTNIVLFLIAYIWHFDVANKDVFTWSTTSYSVQVLRVCLCQIRIV